MNFLIFRVIQILFFIRFLLLFFTHLAGSWFCNAPLYIMWYVSQMFTFCIWTLNNINYYEVIDFICYEHDVVILKKKTCIQVKVALKYNLWTWQFFPILQSYVALDIISKRDNIWEDLWIICTIVIPCLTL